MRIAIVEDDYQELQRLKQFVQRYAEETGIACTCVTFMDGDEILEEYSAEWDMIFLDIQMKRLDGLSAANKIRRVDEDVLLVFVTNLAHLAIKGYAVRAYDYLLKPVNYLIVKKLLNQAAKISERRMGKHIMLQTPQGVRRINIDHILYAEVSDHELTVVLEEEKVTLRAAMSQIEEQLIPYGFFRCHNCYLVNMNHVRRLDKGVVLVGDHTLTVSRPRQKAFMLELTRFVAGGRS